MFKINCLMSFFLIIMLILSIETASAQISIIPYGSGISMEENEDADIEVILINDYEDPVTFKFKYVLVEDEEERRGMPLRDDAGDLLRQFESPVSAIGGLCFDGELLWGGSYSPHQITAVTLDGEERLRFESNADPSAITFDGEVIWASNWSTEHIYTYDLEGNLLEQFDMNFNSISGMASDREQFVFMHCNDDSRIHVISIDNHQEVASFPFRQAMGNAAINGIEWVPDHTNGQLWGNAPGRLYQAFVDDDWNVEAVSDFAWNTDNNRTEPAHDGENMWHGSWAANTWYMFDDGVFEFNAITFEPRTGEVPGEDSIPIEIFFSSIDMEPGVYNSLVTCYTDVDTLKMTFIITIDSPSAFLTCRVIDAETEEVIRGVTVDVDMYHIQRITSRRGLCDFEELPPGEYVFTFQIENYLPYVEQYRIDGEGELFLDVEMLHSECNPSRDNINAALLRDEEIQTEITISNDGNGPLTYTTEKRLLGDANAEPWELRNNYNVSEITQDPRIYGAVFFNDLFYLSGTRNRNPTMYVINREGEVVNQYAQCGTSSIGYKDLAWDGELLWGSGEWDVFGFTPEGELVNSFNANLNPCTNIAWDKDREILWVSSTTSDIFGFDREGNLITELSRQGMRVYGLAYWPDDPDGFQLYIFHKIAGTGNQIVTKINVENGDTLTVAQLEPELGGDAQGCFIINTYDNYSWVFMAIVDDGDDDRLDIWQVDARKDWMDIEPPNGVIEAGEEQDFTITLNSAELPEAIFEGEIVFLHDGLGGETTISISLEVGENGGEIDEEINIALANSWNIISAYVQPDPDDIVEIMSELVEAEQLIIMKDGAGHFYNPAFDFNNIPGWRVNEGYLVNLDGDAEMIISGNPVNPDDPLPLIEGWQMVSYYPRQGIDAVIALSGIVDNLRIAKNYLGRFYNPEFNFSNMGDMIPTQGYMLNMRQATELIYTIEEEVACLSTPYRLPSLLPIHPATSENMSLLILTEVQAGEIGVYTNGNLVGSGVIEDGKCGIAVWGDDPTTPEIDGALEGESLELRLHIEPGAQIYYPHYEVIEGNGLYHADDFQAIELHDVIETPDDFGIASIYPNPFNNHTSITYNLPEAVNVNLALFDLAGRRVSDLVSGQKPIGQHSIMIDASALSSGVYIVLLQSQGGISKSKLTLIK